MGCWGLQWVLLGAAHAATIENPPVSSKKPLPTQTCRCHLAPQHCGAQVQCQVNRLMCADFPSHRTLMEGGKYDCTVRFPPPTVLLGIIEKRSKLPPCGIGCTWFLLTITETAPQEKHDQRLLLKERSSPDQLNKERSRAYGEQSDRSHSS